MSKSSLGPGALCALVALALTACSVPAPRTSAVAVVPGGSAPSGGAWRTLSSSELMAQEAPAPSTASQGAEPPHDDAEALAKKLANPIAALISVPFQANYDSNIGPVEDGSKYYVNVQPVVPITLNEDWNLISRTILPLVHQEHVAPGSGIQDGTGDTTQSLFFSPAKPTESGLVWGAGPVFLVPTASDDLLGGEKWGLGPTGVVLKQHGPWTYGALANHIWSVAGDDDRADISSTFLQPFVAYTTKEAWTYTLNTESTYDWEDEEWAVPINAVVSKVTRIGDQLVSVGGGLRWWADSAPDGPEGLGVRFIVTLLYPRK
jgi:hypothetical protein